MNSLKRSLGVFLLIFYGVGMILGAGIYSIIGKAAAETKETLWIGFLIAGISAFLTALSYAELSSLYPKAGAEFIYLQKAFPKKKWLGSIAGIAMAFSGAATAATVALAFSGYLNQFIEIPIGLTAGVVLIFFTLIALIGINTSGWVTVVSTLIEIAGLIFIIYLGWRSDQFGEALKTTPHLGTLSGSALIIFSFFGFENIVNLAEEAKTPEKDLPRAILASVIIALILYVLVSLSALALLNVDQLANSSAPLMEAARAGAQEAGKILGAIALFSTANTVLISMIGASRILYGMAKEQELPEIISTTLSKRKTPWIASVLILLTAFLFLPLGKLEVVASVSSLSTLLAFLGVNIALIRLRYTQASKQRPFRVFSFGRFPILAALGSLCCLALLLQFDSQIYLINGLFLLIMVLIFKARENFS